MPRRPISTRRSAAAQSGFKTWRKVSAFERGKILRKAADLVRARVEEIATALTFEQGKLLAEAKLEILGSRRHHRLVRRRRPRAPMAASFRRAPMACATW